MKFTIEGLDPDLKVLEGNVSRPQLGVDAAGEISGIPGEDVGRCWELWLQQSDAFQSAR